MKRILLILVGVLCLLPNLQATHLMGGEITARYLNTGADYEVTLTTYRDTLGIPMTTMAQMELTDALGTVISTYSVPQDPALSGALLPGYPYGVEVYVFKVNITLPAIGTYNISFQNCCRNGAIQNLANPLSENMYLTTELTYFGTSAGFANSTPTFLVQPVIFLPVTTPWQYNPLPFDPDGDSLVWSIDTSLNNLNSNVAGYTTPPGDPMNPFTIDASTGTIYWTANTLGNFNASILVEEYRGGAKIGEIRRDMQFIVVPTGGNTLPEFTNLGDLPVGANGFPLISIIAGQGYNLSLLASDPDPLDAVTLEAFGEPFLVPQTQATFTVGNTGNGNQVEGLFSWYPDVSLARDNPYMVVFRVRDQQFTFDETVFMDVSKNTTGIEEPKDLSIGSLYPNPATSSLYIPFTLDKSSEMSFAVYSYTGAKVKDLGATRYPSGNHIVKTDTGLSPGAYFLTIEQDGNLVKAQKFIIAH